MSGHRRLLRGHGKRKPGVGKPGADKTAVKAAMDCTWSQEGIDARHARGMKKGKEHKGKRRKEG
jgi:hypothetical protein